MNPPYSAPLWPLVGQKSAIDTPLWLMAKKSRKKKREPVRYRKPVIGKRIFDTMKVASGALNLSMPYLRAAKNKGCPAFNHGRVHEEQLLTWLKDNPVPDDAPSKDTAQIAVLQQQERRLRIANDLREGVSIPKSTVRDVHAKVLARFKDSMFAKLCNEFPSYAAGQDVPTVRTMVRRVADELLAQLSEIGVKEWGDQ